MMGQTMIHIPARLGAPLWRDEDPMVGTSIFINYPRSWLERYSNSVHEFLTKK